MVLYCTLEGIERWVSHSGGGGFDIHIYIFEMTGWTRDDINARRHTYTHSFKTWRPPPFFLEKKGR